MVTDEQRCYFGKRVWRRMRTCMIEGWPGQPWKHCRSFWGSERKMKAIATRGRSYGKFFVGACWSREGRSFGFQVLEVVWGSHGVASGDVPRLRGGRGNGPDGAGPSRRRKGDSTIRSSGDGELGLEGQPWKPCRSS